MICSIGTCNKTETQWSLKYRNHIGMALSTFHFGMNTTVQEHVLSIEIGFRTYDKYPSSESNMRCQFLVWDSNFDLSKNFEFGYKRKCNEWDNKSSKELQIDASSWYHWYWKLYCSTCSSRLWSSYRDDLISLKLWWP